MIRGDGIILSDDLGRSSEKPLDMLIFQSGNNLYQTLLDHTNASSEILANKFEDNHLGRLILPMMSDLEVIKYGFSFPCIQELSDITADGIKPIPIPFEYNGTSIDLFGPTLVEEDNDGHHSSILRQF